MEPPPGPWGAAAEALSGDLSPAAALIGLGVLNRRARALEAACAGLEAGGEPSEQER